MPRSIDSGIRPLHHRYESAQMNDSEYDLPNRYGDTYKQTAYNAKGQRSGLSPWIKFGIPVLVLVIIGGVVGAVIATRHKDSNDSANPSQSSGSKESGKPANGNGPVGLFFTSTDAFGLPVYPKTVRSLLPFSITQYSASLHFCFYSISYFTQ
jgi:hypothetical protein